MMTKARNKLSVLELLEVDIEVAQANLENSLLTLEERHGLADYMLELQEQYKKQTGDYYHIPR